MIGLTFDDHGDIASDGGQLLTDNGLESAVFLSLFLDAYDDTETDPRGWWADATPDRIGSLLWKLEREKLTDKTRAAAEEYATASLQWMVSDGIAESVRVTATIIPRETIHLDVFITRPKGDSVTYKYAYAWDAQAERLGRIERVRNPDIDAVIWGSGGPSGGGGGAAWGAGLGGVAEGEYCYAFHPSEVFTHDLGGGYGAYYMVADGNNLVSPGGIVVTDGDSFKAIILQMNIWGDEFVAAIYSALASAYIPGTNNVRIKLTINGGFIRSADSIKYRINLFGTDALDEDWGWGPVATLTADDGSDYVIDVAAYNYSFGEPYVGPSFSLHGAGSALDLYPRGTYDFTIKQVSFCVVPA